ITAHQARRLTLDRDITRLLTDPINGQLLGISERQYRPSSQLERLVRTRDWVCRFPGCSRPATTKHSGTDLDHTVPWPEGETAASNLAVLCRHHHRLKHSPGWSVSLASDGAMSWTTPTGKTFVTQARVHADTG
ncbi:MAG: HNH endonuclease signature motif containing protein, partial [Actinomycetes bacterium]